MHLLRRLLWLVPGLAAVTLVAFAVLSALIRPEDELAGLPVFFNANPGQVQQRSARALAIISEHAPGHEQESERLAELGGAALPFVLPLLDSLPPKGRGRVVRALEPVRRRMGLASDGRLGESQHVLFWLRFWQEYSIDFRPVVVSRAVSRLAMRPTPLRVAEVRRFDTYALESLIGALGEVQTQADADRVTHLADLLRPLIGTRDVLLMRPDTVAEARQFAAYCVEWWTRNRTRFRTYQGTERIVAVLRDTRYGTWVAEALRSRLGRLRSGSYAGEEIATRAWITVPLLLAGIIGAMSSSMAWRALRALRSAAANRARLLGWAATSLPSVVVAAALSAHDWDVESRWPLALGCMLVLGALSSPPRVGVNANDRRTAAIVQTLRAMGWSAWQAAARSLPVSRPAMAGQASARVAALGSMCFVVETALSLPGIGSMTVDVLQQPDLNWLMAIILVGALCAAALQIVIGTLFAGMSGGTLEAQAR